MNKEQVIKDASIELKQALEQYGLTTVLLSQGEIYNNLNGHDLFGSFENLDCIIEISDELDFQYVNRDFTNLTQDNYKAESIEDILMMAWDFRVIDFDNCLVCTHEDQSIHFSPNDFQLSDSLVMIILWSVIENLREKMEGLEE